MTTCATVKHWEVTGNDMFGTASCGCGNEFIRHCFIVHGNEIIIMELLV